MKVIAIGDTHGRKLWEEIVKQPANRYVFIGDYFDTHGTETAHQQLKNFEGLLDFKKANPRKVVLLIGNHDFHYLRVAGLDRYSGFQDHHQEMIRDLLEGAIEHGYMQMAYEQDGVLYTHAGVTNTWCKEQAVHYSGSGINALFASRPEVFKFNMRGRSPYGDDPCQGPLWVRPVSLKADKVPRMKQVVGHTQMDALAISESIAFIDVLGTSREYLEVIDGEFRAARFLQDTNNLEK